MEKDATDVVKPKDELEYYKKMVEFANKKIVELQSILNQQQSNKLGGTQWTSQDKNRSK